MKGIHSTTRRPYRMHLHQLDGFFIEIKKSFLFLTHSVIIKLMSKGWNEEMQNKIIKFHRIFFLRKTLKNIFPTKTKFKIDFHLLSPNTSPFKIENNFPPHPIHLLSLTLLFCSPFRLKLCHEYEL